MSPPPDDPAAPAKVAIAPAVAPGPRRAGGALAVAAGIFLSRIAGLLRESVFAHYLGNSRAAGAYRAALRIPNVLQNLLGEGVLSASFIPVYARLLAEGKEEEAGRVAGVVASLLALAVGLLVALGVSATSLVIDVIAPGFTGADRALTIRLVRIMFPGIGLLVLAAWCLGVLNSHRRFFLSYVAPVLSSIAVIAALVVFGAGRDPTAAAQARLAETVGWGTVIGAGLQLALQAPVALRLVRGLRLSLDARLPAARAVLRGFLPVVVARGVVQLSAYIDSMLASYLGTAAVSEMGYAQLVYTLPISLFGMSVSAAELPEMSREIGAADEVAARLRRRIDVGIERIAFFVVPSAVAFLALGDVVVGALFQTGQFGGGDTRAVWMILAGSTVGLVATTQSRLFSSGFYALRDTRTPLRFAALRVTLTAVAAWACALPLQRHFGWRPEEAAAAMTGSAGAAGWIEYFLLRRALARRLGGISVGAGILLRLWGSAALAAGCAYAVERVLPPLHPKLVAVGVLGVYGVVYLGVTAALRLREAQATVDRALRLFLRRRT